MHNCGANRPANHLTNGSLEMNMNAREEKTVYIVTSNSDLTEGKGVQQFKYYCWARSTAERIAKGAGVMGSDADVIALPAYLHDFYWYLPALDKQIFQPTQEDTDKEVQRSSALATFKKMKAKGFSDKEIKLVSEYSEYFTV